MTNDRSEEILWNHIYCCRDIHSLVEIVTGHFTLLDDCVMILEESMPSGLYVNPDQLADMRRFGQVCLENEALL